MSSSTTTGPVSAPCCSEEISQTTEYPVRFGDGEVMLSETDLSASAFGFSWGHTRSYGNQLSSNNTGYWGNSWLVSQDEYLAIDGDSITNMRGISNSIGLKDKVGGWRPQMGWKVKLYHLPLQYEYVLVNENTGTTKYFYDNSAGVPWYHQGKLKKVVLAGGEELSNGAELTIIRDGIGRITEWKVIDGATQPTGMRFTYQYNTSGAGNGRVNEILQEEIKLGVYTNLRKAEYTYYDGTEDFGNANDLKIAEVLSYDDSQWKTLRKHYYRSLVSS